MKLSNKSIAWLIVIVLSVWISSPSLAASNPDAPLIAQIRSHDPAVRQKGAEAIGAMLDSPDSAVVHHAVGMLHYDWMNQLAKNGQDEAVVKLALKAILAAPNKDDYCEGFQRDRVKSLLRLKRYKEALSQAKALYNIAGMKTTDDALALVAQCLQKASADGLERVSQFKTEQIAGAKSTTRPAAPTILQSIQIDDTPYRKTIELYLQGRDFITLTGAGNLLLLAGRAKEARAPFEAAYSLAYDDKQLAKASENLAKVMKAEDGTIGRANAFVLSLRPGK